MAIETEVGGVYVFRTMNSAYTLRVLNKEPLMVRLVCTRGTLQSKGVYEGQAPYGMPRLGEIFVLFTEAKGDVRTSLVSEVGKFDPSNDVLPDDL